MLKLKPILEKCLCPAGDGVFTVNTASQHKLALQSHLYQTEHSIRAAWLQHINKLEHANSPLILGIASDCGGGIQRGANWGPLFIREALYRHYPNLACFDLGDIRVIPHLLHDKYLNNKTLSECRTALYNTTATDLPVSPLSIAEYVANNLHQTFPNKKLFTLGGDHSISYPIIKSLLNQQKQQSKKIGLLQFDAHTDLLKNRLGIDLCFGSWTYHILEHLDDPKCLLQVGIRSTGQPKAYWESTYDIKQIWANEAPNCSQNIIQHFQSQQIDALYITFDIDCLDESEVSATGTPEPNGLSTNTAIHLIQQCAQAFPIIGADLVEVAPFVNKDPESTLTAASTIANELIKSLAMRRLRP